MDFVEVADRDFGAVELGFFDEDVGRGAGVVVEDSDVAGLAGSLSLLLDFLPVNFLSRGAYGVVAGLLERVPVDLGEGLDDFEIGAVA